MRESDQWVLTRLYKYCAYQERCRKEVEKKLSELGVDQSDWPRLLAHLEAERFLDERRFAHSFARGKFTLKKWGRYKILAALRSKGISQSLAQQALANEVSDQAYFAVLDRLVEQKTAQWQHLPARERKDKILRYLKQKGYEWNLIWERLK